MTTTYTYENKTELTTAELVLAAQAGQSEAFGQLYERYERAVMATALRRLGNYAEAQELCQDVFLQAFRKLSQLRVPEAFGGWLRSIVGRMATNRIMRRPPMLPTEPEMLEATCIDEFTPFDAALERENAQEVRDGLDELQDLDRETLEAFYVQGKSLLEMSDDFAAPVGTIKRRLHVARKRLARRVEPLVAV